MQVRLKSYKEILCNIYGPILLPATINIANNAVKLLRKAFFSFPDLSNTQLSLIGFFEIEISFIISEKLRRIVKFYCNFGAIVKIADHITDRYFFRQIIAGWLLVLFCAFQFIQFHHHHGSDSSKTASSKTSNVHHKCDICDFVAKKQNSHLEHQETTVPLAVELPVSRDGFHYQTNWYFACAILTDNKGPPTLI